MKRGIFITFEGGDGSGKSTQIDFLREYFENKKIDYISTREPGGTPISEKIRGIILDKDNVDMAHMTEALLSAASRAQHVKQLIAPALERGKVVICDRFVDSSIAYQGYGSGLGDSVGVINSYAIGEYMPDVTFFLDLPAEVGLGRINGCRDRIESEEITFHREVAHGYDEIKEKYKGRIITLDALKSPEEIRKEIIVHVDKILGEISFG